MFNWSNPNGEDATGTGGVNLDKPGPSGGSSWLFCNNPVIQLRQEWGD